MINPVIFGVVGGGWRAEFYFRIAQAMPERFQIAGCVARTEATRARIKAAWKTRIFDELDPLLDQHPHFVVVSVPWAAEICTWRTSPSFPERTKASRAACNGWN